ncbi:MAG TPA: hypothetical protein VHM92_05265 [Allosphingosinicella sp.]|nr:hypothetical protein [Allosphingosinicella sp.]
MRLGLSPFVALAGAMLLAGCAAKTAAPARPEPVAPPPAPVQPAPAAPAPSDDWRDLPPTPGDWTYRRTSAGSEARYGPSEEAPVFALACEAARRQVRLTRPGAAGSLTLRTSYRDRAIGSAAQATVDANDALLDEIAFSRGRFVVEGVGPRLVLPAWPEPARVIEDCRE